MALQAGDNIRHKVPRPPSETRKIRKPLMERKRRERINTSLNDLATLLTEARLVKSEAGRPTKLEKADILELTVKHMLSLKGRAGGACQEFLKGGSAEGVIPQGRPAVQEYHVPQGSTSPLGSVPHGNNSTQGGPVSGEDTIPQGGKVQQDGTVPDDANTQGDMISPKVIVTQRTTSSPVTTAMALQDSEDKVSAAVTQGTATMCATDKDENYRLGFKRCMSAIDSAMKQYLENQQDNIRPRLLQHLHNFLMMMEGKNSTSSGDTESASTSTSKISTQGHPPAHATAPSNAVTSSFKGEASSSPVTGLTLVPTRLPGGGLAFVIQGPLDPSVLLRTAEDTKNLDSHNLSKIGIINVKAEAQQPPATTTAASVVSNTVQVSSATATPAKLEPGKVKTEKSKCENINDISKHSCTENPLMEEQTFTSAPGKLTVNSEVNKSSVFPSSPVTSVTSLIPSVKVTSFNKPAEKSASKRNLHRLPPTPPTPPTRGTLPRTSPPLSTPTTATPHTTNIMPRPTLPIRSSGSHFLPPTLQTPSPQLRHITITTPTSPTLIKEGSPSASTNVGQDTHLRYLELTPASTTRVCSVHTLTPETTPPGTNTYKLQQSSLPTPKTCQNKYMMPLTPPSPPTPRILQPAALSKSPPPPPPPPSMPPLQEEEAMEQGEEVVMDVLMMDVLEDQYERRQHNNIPFDLSLRRMWRPW